MDDLNISYHLNVVTRVAKVVSDEAREIYMFVNYMTVVNFISIFGCVTNIMNIIIFYKQGFNNTMNISFFGLAISDLLSLVALLWFDLCLNPLFEKSGVLMVPPEIQHLTGGIPHICFVRITGWITVFITAERCLCIVVPLRIKQIITPKRTTIMICSIYIIIMTSFFPEYATSFIGWRFYPDRNKTLLGLAFTSNRNSMAGIVFIMYSILGMSSFIAVIVFTIVLTVTLNQKTQWRRHASSVQEGSTTNRDKKTVSMVVLLATIVIVCYIPGVAVSSVVFFEPEFSIVGKYVNAFFVAWSFTFIFEATNASVNIFLYYKMSTKYRETFREVFGFSNKQEIGRTKTVLTNRPNTTS